MNPAATTPDNFHHLYVNGCECNIILDLGPIKVQKNNILQLLPKSFLWWKKKIIFPATKTDLCTMSHSQRFLSFPFYFDIKRKVYNNRQGNGKMGNANGINRIFIN